MVDGVMSLPEGSVIKLVQLFSCDTAPQDMSLSLLAFYDGAPQKLCGVRVDYISPPIFVTFLPTVQH